MTSSLSTTIKSAAFAIVSAILVSAVACTVPCTDAGVNVTGDAGGPYWATWTEIAAGASQSTVVRNDGSTLELDIETDGAPALCVR